MANKTNTVTIPLEEYKALLLKEVPTDKERLIVETLLESIKCYGKIVDIDSYSSDFKGIDFNSPDKILKEVMSVVFSINRQRFIDLYKEMVREKREDEVKLINAEYMRKIKELKND